MEPMKGVHNPSTTRCSSNIHVGPLLEQQNRQKKIHLTPHNKKRDAKDSNKMNRRETPSNSTNRGGNSRKDTNRSYTMFDESFFNETDSSSSCSTGSNNDSDSTTTTTTSSKSGGDDNNNETTITAKKDRRNIFSSPKSQNSCSIETMLTLTASSEKQHEQILTTQQQHQEQEQEQQHDQHDYDSCYDETTPTTTCTTIAMIQTRISPRRFPKVSLSPQKQQEQQEPFHTHASSELSLSLSGSSSSKHKRHDEKVHHLVVDLTEERYSIQQQDVAVVDQSAKFTIKKKVKKEKNTVSDIKNEVKEDITIIPEKANTSKEVIEKNLCKTIETGVSNESEVQKRNKSSKNYHIAADDPVRNTECIPPIKKDAANVCTASSSKKRSTLIGSDHNGGVGNTNSPCTKKCKSSATVEPIVGTASNDKNTMSILHERNNIKIITGSANSNDDKQPQKVAKEVPKLSKDSNEAHPRTERSDSTKEKSSVTKEKKKKISFQDQVVNHLFTSFKPCTLKSLSDSLKTSERQLEFLMLSLLDKGAVYKKDFPNSKGTRTTTLYWMNYESKIAKDYVSSTSVSSDDIELSKAELIQLRTQIGTINNTLANVLQLPSNHELMVRLEEAERALQQLYDTRDQMKQRIETSFGCNAIGTTTTTLPTIQNKTSTSAACYNSKTNERHKKSNCVIEETKHRINYMEKVYKERKRKCNDFIEQLADAMEKKPVVVRQMLDVEVLTDNDDENDDNNNNNNNNNNKQKKKTNKKNLLSN